MKKPRDDVLTTGDIAAELGIQPSTVRAYHSRGQMPPARGHVGRSPYWHRADVTDWITRVQAHRAASPKAAPAP